MTRENWSTLIKPCPTATPAITNSILVTWDWTDFRSARPVMAHAATTSRLLIFILRNWRSEDGASWYILIVSQREAPISQIYFWNRTLHVSERFSVHHQENSTVYTTIGICHTGYADCLLAGSGCNILIPLVSSQHNLYVLLCILY
jgi:hypothetical protein